ncbi:MAG: hypothetical protein JXA77_05100 [Bacteroidales bacterium]|nr:hypothetical protein [Bacteroidales bacterium]MBN2820425.1 hypothetical protein [Bacteroidales bacterium]
MIEQKLEYIHNNPIEEEIVNNEEDYKYSSAINYSLGNGLMMVELLLGIVTHRMRAPVGVNYSEGKFFSNKL